MSTPPPSQDASRVGPTLCGAGALVLSTAALAPVFRDASWVPTLLAVVVLVAGTGAGMRSLRAPLPLVAAVQVMVVSVLVTVLFTNSGVGGVLPGPDALGEVRNLLDGAGTQIQDQSVPAAVSSELRLLLVLLIGAAAVVVDGLVAGVSAPATAGLVLLTVFAVPAALVRQLLPWWAFVAGGAGLVLLLVADGTRRAATAGPAAGSAGLRSPAVGSVAAVAVVVGLLAGSAGLGVGTGGRLAGSGSGGVALNPFTQLRGQLDQPNDVPLFTVRGMATPSYLRALSLDTYVPNQGWVLSGTTNDQQLDSSLGSTGRTRGEAVDVTIAPQQYVDRWLPTPGNPQRVTGTDGALADYSFDRTADTLYTRRSRSLPTYRVQSVVPGASAAALRAAGTPTAGEVGAPDQRFYRSGGIDPQVSRLANDVAGAQPTALDRAVTISDYLRNPANGYRYDLRTAGNGTGTDALVDFLTVGKVGFCEQFASAMTAMLRTLDIPARVGVGFTAGTGDAAVRQITTKDAHAWVEVYFSGTGWVVFDPTPLGDGRGIVPPYVTQAQQSPAVPGPTPNTQQAEPTPAAPVPTGAAVPQRDQAGDTTTATTPADAPSAWPRRLSVTALVLTAVTLLAGAPAGLRAMRRRRRVAAGSAEAAWDELLDTATDRGADPRPSDTARQAAVRIIDQHHLDSVGAAAVHSVVDGVEQAWYGAAATRGSTVLAPTQPVGDALRVALAAFRVRAPLPLRRRLFPRSLRARKADAPPR